MKQKLILEAIERFKNQPRALLRTRPLGLVPEGAQLIYVPSHLNTIARILDPNNWGYPSRIEPGFVIRSSLNASGISAPRIWVRFWLYDPDKQDFVTELRTRANSELITDTDFYPLDFFPEETVSKIRLEMIW